jgi:2-C-methyl-D-erythritol 2,4-cyclodiphosphate synthase
VRVGIGYDSHRFVEGRKLILGGVEIPYSKGLAGHSDADVVAHAITDAILGAAGMGDIGALFPNTDPQWQNADSIHLLNKAYMQVVETRLHLVNVDVTVIAEQPPIALFVEEMREKLAGALVCERSDVSVKGKTNERMGFIGRGEGIAAIAVAVLE